jgi:plasmid maintenance system killer protein
LRIEYLDTVLRRLAIEAGHRPAGWSSGAILAYRETVQCLDAAVADTDLRALRSLRMRMRPDLKSGAWSIQLDDVLVLVLAFKGDGPGAVAVLELLNNNWEARDE